MNEKVVINYPKSLPMFFGHPVWSAVYFIPITKLGTQYAIYSKNMSYTSCRDSLNYYILSIPKKARITVDYKGYIGVGTTSDIKMVQKVINYAEELLSEKSPTVGRTVFYPTQYDNYYLAEISGYWLERSYLTSLWALLVRQSCQLIKESKDPHDVLFKKTSGGYWNPLDPCCKAVQNFKYFVKYGTYITNEPTPSGLGITSLIIPDFDYTVNKRYNE